MHKNIIARIRWVPTEQGGRKRLPSTGYSTAAQFLADEEGQGWSIILNMVDYKYENFETICGVSFLFPERVPNSVIYVGSKFELFEAKKVADGEIIDLE
jgi:hypothetical protein